MATSTPEPPAAGTPSQGTDTDFTRFPTHRAGSAVPDEASPAYAQFEAAAALNGELPGKLQNFRVLSRIGEGGMGAVYLASQTAPVKRQVAIKIIKRSVDTPEARLRMDIEWQSMARFDHPHIARFIDCGYCERIPYMVIELVQGPTIIEYCAHPPRPGNATGPGESEELPLRERLELFRQVCDAVGHAHQKQVLHRDISDKNILVTGTGAQASVKVIDFGISVLMDDERVVDRGLIGTLAYMSPEQVEGGSRKLDSRSDVYSLGVLLFELITGQRPYQVATGLEARAQHEAMRTGHVTVVPSAKVLARLKTEGIHSRHRLHVLRRLGKTLRGDLDAIVAKAMSLRPQDRYASVAELSDDLRLFLAHYPLQKARPPRPGIVALRFFQRNWLACIATLLALVFLVAATVVSVRSSARLADSNHRIEGEQLKLRGKSRELEKSNATLRDSHANAYAANLRSLPDFLRNGELAAVRQVLRSTAVAPDELSSPRDWEWHHYLARIEGSDFVAGLCRAGFSRVLDAGAVMCGLAADRSVWFWDARERKYLGSECLHQGAILAGCAVGGRCLTFDADGLLLVWNAENGSLARRASVAADWLAAGQPESRSAAFSPDGSLLCVQRFAGGKWELALAGTEPGGLALQPLPVPAWGGAALAAWRGESLFVLGRLADRGTLCLQEWRAPGGRGAWQCVRQTGDLQVLDVPLALPESFACVGPRFLFQYPIGAILCTLQESSSGGNTWTVAAQDAAFLRGNGYWLGAAALSPDGKLVATGGSSQDRTIRLWDAATGEFQGKLTGRPDDLGTLLGHDGGITSLCFTHDSPAQLLSSSEDGTVCRWKVSPPRYGRHLLPARPAGGEEADPSLLVWLRFIQRGTQTELLGVSSRFPWITTWNAETGEPSSATPPPSGQAPDTLEVTAAGASRNGGVVALARRQSAGAGAGSCDLLVGDLADPNAPLPAPTGQLPAPVHSVAVSPDGRWVALAGGRFAPADNTVCRVLLWRVQGGKLQEPAVELAGLTADVNPLAFAEDSGTLAAGGEDGVLHLWDLTKPNFPGRAIVFPGGAALHSLAFSHSGTQIAVARKARVEGTDDQYQPLGFALCDLSTGAVTLPRADAGPSDLMHALCWNRADTRIATAENDGTMRLWAVADGTWRSVLTFRDASGFMSAAAWSDDAEWLAGGCAYTGAFLYRGQPSAAEDRFFLRELQRETPLRHDVESRWRTVAVRGGQSGDLEKLLAPFGDDPVAVNEWAWNALNPRDNPRLRTEIRSSQMLDLWSEARREMQAAAGQRSQSWELQRTLALAEYRCRNYAAAIAKLENSLAARTASAESKADPVGALLLAMAYKQDKQEERAAAQWAEAQRLRRVTPVHFDAGGSEEIRELLFKEADNLFREPAPVP